MAATMSSVSALSALGRLSVMTPALTALFANDILLDHSASGLFGLPALSLLKRAKASCHGPDDGWLPFARRFILSANEFLEPRFFGSC